MIFSYVLKWWFLSSTAGEDLKVVHDVPVGCSNFSQESGLLS